MSLGHKHWGTVGDRVSRHVAILIPGVLLLLSGCRALDGPQGPGAASIEAMTTGASATAVFFPSEAVEATIVLPFDPSPAPKFVRVAVPEHLFSIFSEATRMAYADHPQWIWITLASAQANDAFGQGQAQLAVMPGAEGILVGRTPLVLAVPFTSRWEGVTFEEAQSILATGNDLVSILDWWQKPPTTRALKIDGFRPSDPDYPLQRDWRLIAAEGYESAALDLAPYVSDGFQAAPCVHLAAVGDIMLDRALGRAIEEGKTDYPFGKVADLLARADITVGNFESALGEGGEAEDKGYTFRAPIGAIDALKLAGFDVLSLANNHAMDYGAESMLEAIALLDESGIAAIGAGMDQAAAHAPVFLEVQGLRLAFLAYVDVPVEGRGFDARQWMAGEASPGVAWAEPEQIQNDVASARSIADVVIVLLHSGYEYIPEPNEIQIAAAHAAIEGGAALVLGHHAHTLQPLEFYQGGVIAYGLGNFAFERAGPAETIILNVWLDRYGVRELEIIPVLIQYDGRPDLAPEERADQIRTGIYGQTEFFAYLQQR